jgi:hypothetical protein
MTRLPRRALSGLRLLVLAHLTLHAFFSPVYEGPDEPFHLARARAFAEGPFAEALAGEVVDADLVHSLRAWPCGPAMHAAFDCPSFGREKAAFNIVEPARRAGGDGSASSNYQAHQPPVYYLAAASVLGLFAPAIGTAPESQILLLRLAAVLLVGCVLCFPIRRLGKGNAHFETLLLLALLLPGAAESLIRVSNDVAVFAWAVLMVAALSRRDAISTKELALLAAVGPLLKLTAFPVVAVAAVVGWRARGWRPGLLIGASGLAVFPLQWLRGWAWGGTLEANTPLGALGSLSEILLGLVHSAATFLKTAVWLGGWTFFRPPTWVLVAIPLLGLIVIVRCLRLRSPMANRGAHLAGGALAAAGFVAFALGQRQIFGVWGGVGGWYLWGWAPWLALLACDLLEVRSARERELTIGALGAVTVLNAAWFEVAVRTYGS